MKNRELIIRICAITMTLLMSVSAMTLAYAEPVMAATTTKATTTAKKTAKKKVTFNEAKYRKLKSRTISCRSIGVNLRTMIGEGSSGYSIVQGGCTDGKYAYYLMVSGSTQHGRILKVRIKDNQVVARSGILNTWHGNGMAYDSKRNQIAVIAREHRKQEITIIDANTLRIKKQQDAKYSHFKNASGNALTANHQSQGLAAIAYVKKYDCYIALERVYHNLIVFNPVTLQAEGFIITTITTQYPGTYQAMDADEKYVYLLLSAYQDAPSRQPNNVILALDWNSEKMLPVINSRKRTSAYVKKAWYCNNNKSGKPDAAIRINVPYEAENIYHLRKRGGKGHFFLSTYHGHSVYKNGRYQYFGRDDYVYDLGIF